MRPPRFWTLLLTLCATEDSRETVLGDFHEEYAARFARSQDRTEANAWYRRQVIRSLPAFFAVADLPPDQLGLWRYGIAILLATTAACACVFVPSIVVEQVAPSLARHGLLGYSDLFWCYVVVAALAAFVAGWHVLSLAGRRDVRVGIWLAAAWLVTFAVPSLIGWSPMLPSGAWLMLLVATSMAVVGSACRVVWDTRGLRVSS